VQDPLPVWIAVGGNPQSVVRAGVLGLPMALAIIGGQPERFVPLIDLYRQAVSEAGHYPATARVSINSHTYVGDPDDFFPSHSAMMNRIGRERGWPPMARAQWDQLRGPRGAFVVGSPDEVVEKILFERELFGNDRYLAQIALGDLSHDLVMRAIERFGTEVAPRVRAEVGSATVSRDWSH
jgi:alkanesulfonate monooxygenase SsuD/methylene tetrahydromethanopterin reductase-like flavin-dependent oxidoreductase (luciferase family)